MSNRLRTIAALVLFLTISSPMSALPPRGKAQSRHPVVDPIARLWERITAPVIHLLKGRGALDPNGGTDSTTTACDPATCGDGRGALDPNG
jgi:hypothetical protein